MTMLQSQTLPDTRREFIAAHFERTPEAKALPADASPRRYYRLEVAPKLLMEVEPGAVDFEAFVRISRHLNALGLSAPKIFSVDFERGLALIEDFGHGTFTRLLAAGRSEEELYGLAVDALIHLHEAAGATRIDVPDYDHGPLFEELAMFTDWFVPQCAPDCGAAAFNARFLDLWKAALSGVAGSRDALVLRDYHVDNLMVIEGREGIAACGLLDFQDALIGSAAYDLVSLTQDARRAIDPVLEEQMIERYVAGRPGLDRQQFLAEYWLLAAHRHTKILGNFERLSKRDGKHGYLVHLPHVARLLDKALTHAGLDDIRAAMDEALPSWRDHAPVAPNSLSTSEAGRTP